MKRILPTLALTLILILATVSSAAAQGEEPADPEPTETTEPVSGQIIDVDPITGTITLLTPEGEIVTIALITGEYTHPIVALLGSYFGGTTFEEYAELFDQLVIDAADGVVDAEGNPVEGTVLGVEPVLDEEGNVTGWTLTLRLADDSETTVLIEDETLATGLQETLDQLSDVEFDGEVGEGEDGEPTYSTDTSAADEIAAYHEMGIGFGELVKLYAIAQEQQAACEAAAAAAAADETEADPGTGEDVPACGVTVEELIAMLQSGMGMGDLFKLYGKPALLGVGHVRQDFTSVGITGTAAGDTTQATTTDGEGGQTTICHKPDGKNGGQTMTVNSSALGGHLGHGDFIGACP